MTKQTKVQEYIESEKQARTIKVVTIFKVLGILAFGVAMLITGWFLRSDFSNEVKSEVRTQMSVMQEADTVSKTNK